LSQFCRQPGVTSLSFCSGEFIAAFKVAELVFQQKQLGAEKQVFVGVIRGVVRDGGIPSELFTLGASSGCRDGGRIPFCVGALLSLLIQGVMEVDPKSAVQFEDWERSVLSVDLRPARGAKGAEQQDGEQKNGQSSESQAHHVEVPDGSAISAKAQMSWLVRYI
jgi:hypothetical protein